MCRQKHEFGLFFANSGLGKEPLQRHQTQGNY